MNKISTITRRDIFDSMTIEGISWNGRLEETEFLSRLYDLSKMQSTDNRFKDASDDIWQHRVNNYDWEENWIFSDKRFNLMNCDDATFLQFLCEMLHPIVRSDTTQVSELHHLFNEYLSKDNFELVEKTRISGRPIFIGRHKIFGKGTIEKSKKEIEDYLSEEYVVNQINIMESAIENSPELAIGTSKELIETICHTILIERKIEIDKNWELLQLLKQTTKQLYLAPEGIPDEAKASKSIKSILGSLTTVVQGIGELRNQYGSGHGKKASFKGLTARHAKLSVGAASTLAIFLLETHKHRQ
ncbi:MAG TPA: abortive infection family protein [Bacteroidia bacterium]|nr:abortive infection family protein [Bacteroidia bacterium]HNR49448.1 abortive infection family protein [Bacteroidia bacterium]HNT82758.1 abortive infection family protein [Bacteroidia bacterium]